MSDSSCGVGVATANATNDANSSTNDTTVTSDNHAPGVSSSWGHTASCGWNLTSTATDSAVSTNSNGWTTYSSGSWGSSRSNTTTTSSKDEENQKQWKKFIELHTVSSWGATAKTSTHSSSAASHTMDTTTDDDDQNVKPYNFLKGRPFLPKNIKEPKNVISAWYSKRYKITVDNRYFLSWHDNGKPAWKFTSAFVCPVSGEVFLSGQWNEDSNYEIRREGECDSVWYSKKKIAEHAVSARALDILSYREGNCIPTMSYGLCTEDPYDCPKEDIMTQKPILPLSIPTTYLTVIEKIRNEIKTSQQEKEMAMEIVAEKEDGKESTILTNEGTISSSKKRSNTVKATPVQELHQWYQQMHKQDLVRADTFFAFYADAKPSKLFSYVFRCPVTNEIFSCGRFGNEKNYVVVDESVYDGDDEDLVGNETVQVVWYRNKRLAQHGTAARVLDCLRLRKGHDELHHRLCLEEPYMSPENAPPLPASVPII